MEYVITNTHKGFGVAVLLIALAILSWYGYKNWGWFGGTKTEESKKDGDKCTDKNGNPSTYLNGVCQEIVRPNPNGGGSGTGTDNSARYNR